MGREGRVRVKSRRDQLCVHCCESVTRASEDSNRLMDTGDTWATLSAKDFATPPILPQFGNIGTGTSTPAVPAPRSARRAPVC